MKTSCVVTLYSGATFVEGDNAIFDDMAAVLDSMDFDDSLNLTAPFNPSLNVTLKIAWNEKYASAAKDDRSLYAKVVYSADGADRAYYYFVTDSMRIANETLALTLKMDTLNSYNLIGKLDKGTYITREHVDRFGFQSYSTAAHTIWAYALVDKSNEGFSPALYKFSDVKIVDSAYQYDWYLIYKTRDDITQANLTNPVSCYLCADVALKAMTGASGSVVTIAASGISISSHKYVHQDAGDWQFTPNGGPTYSNGQVVSYLLGAQTIPASLVGFAIYKNQEGYVAYDIIGHCYLGDVFIKGNSAAQVTVITLNKTKEYYDISELTNQKADYYKKNVTAINSGTVSNVYSLPFSQIDRSESKLIKIIDLPYCPVTRTTAANGDVSLSGFSFDRASGLYKATDVSAGFSHVIGDTAPSAVLSDALIRVFPYSSKADMLAAAKCVADPKAFNSQFYTFKLSYDAFSCAIALENIAIDDDEQNIDTILTFKATNTINSNFMFSLGFGNATLTGQEDYPAVLLSTRNNEKTIFTNDYINYMKTGYNFDKKAKALSAATSFGSAGLSIATGIGTAVAGSLTGNPITAAAGVGMIGSGIAGISSAITSTIANENAFAAKIASLQAQATSVAGSDDIDLLKAYNGNRLHLSIWKPSADASALFEELFRVYGYKRANYGVPDTSSRTWYNFVAAQIVVEPSANIPAAVLEDESAKWSNGVTVFHLPLGVGSAYDYNRAKENWETSLVNGAFPI